MKALDGIRVAILEARLKDELANLIRNHGGEPYKVPAVREMTIPSAGELCRFLLYLSQDAYDIVVFQTGVGVKALFKEAERQGLLEELIQGLRSVTTVCRGPKPTAALRKAGVQVSIGVREPFTTRELTEALVQNGLMGRRIAVLHYGERNLSLIGTLSEGGAVVDNLCLYEWMLPEDTSHLEMLITEIMAGKVDAIAFTSQIQVRHLHKVAEARWWSRLRLSDALNSNTIVAAVGPTCANALYSFNVAPDVVPAYPKMGHMINDLARYVQSRSQKYEPLVL